MFAWERAVIVTENIEQNLNSTFACRTERSSLCAGIIHGLSLLCFQICAGKRQASFTFLWLLTASVPAGMKLCFSCCLLMSYPCRKQTECVSCWWERVSSHLFVQSHTHRQKLSLTAPLSSRRSHPQHSHYVSWLSTAADITFPQLPVWWVTVLWKHRVAANQQCAEMWCPSSSMRENPQYELSALHLHFRTVYSSFGIWSRSSYYLLHPGKKMCIQLEKHLKMKRLEISRRAGGEENTSAVFSEYDKNNTRWIQLFADDHADAFWFIWQEVFTCKRIKTLQRLFRTRAVWIVLSRVRGNGAVCTGGSPHSTTSD